jgi:hypothetical protein
MKTLFDKATQEELSQRFEKLTSESKSQWGKMSVGQMLAHCTAAMQVPVGDLKLKRTALSLIGWMFKGMIVSEKPFSKNSPTAPEFLMRDDHTFDAEKQRFVTVYNKLTQGASVITCYKHPFFGKMSTEDWGLLMYKHLDHHFQQFGV